MGSIPCPKLMHALALTTDPGVVGRIPSSHIGELVPQWYTGTQEVGMSSPLLNLYHPLIRLLSQMRLSVTPGTNVSLRRDSRIVW